MYITVTGTGHYDGFDVLKVNDSVVLSKDKDNRYDDEAIKVTLPNGQRVGYVANSVHTVARGSHSAGYIYEKFESKTGAVVRFIYDDIAIAEIKNGLDSE